MFKKAKNWPNSKIILFQANCFKKGQIWMVLPLKRPIGNHDINVNLHVSVNLVISMNTELVAILA